MDVYQRRRLVALSVVAGLFIVLVLLIRSCGDDDEGSTTPLSGTTGLEGATTQSRPAYIDSADAICLETNTVLAGIDEASANAAAEEADAIGGELAQLQTLLPPEDGEDELSKFLEALERQAKTLDREALAVEREDTAAADELAAKADEQASTVAKAARKFRFEVCGDLDEVADDSDGDDAADEEAPDTGTVEPPATTPTAPTAPPATEPPATTPPADTGAEGGVGTAPPGTDTGDDSSSGGISP